MRPGSYETRILRVLDHIRDNLDGDLSLDTLAEVAAMSRFHWHRVFHGMTGETLAEAVRRLRVHRAACWLVQTSLPIDRIARQSGYGSAQGFARAFALYYGVPPATFRNRGALVALNPPDRKGAALMYHVEITDVPTHRLAALVHEGPYLEIGSTFGKISAIAASRDLWPEVRGMAAVYYDDPRATEAGALRSHAGIILGDGTAIPEDLDEVHTKAGPAAVLHFKGHYAGLQAAYDHLFGDWLPGSGRATADAPCYEVYLNNPTTTAPDDLLTDIVVPLA